MFQSGIRISLQAGSQPGNPVRVRKLGPCWIARSLRSQRFCTYTLLTNTGRWKMSESKILVVDDSQAVRKAVRRSLVNAGYDVTCASNGYEAIDLLTADFSLMILDIKMPGLDGYEVCEQLKSAGVNFQNLPIIFLTCSGSHALELLGKQYGAYLQKPVAPEVLVAAVKDQLSFNPAHSNENCL
jgi:CheY-like chemotaxis protein